MAYLLQQFIAGADGLVSLSSEAVNERCPLLIDLTLPASGGVVVAVHIAGLVPLFVPMPQPNDVAGGLGVVVVLVAHAGCPPLAVVSPWLMTEDACAAGGGL